MYTEARTDKKLATLSDEEHRVWFNLMCYSAEKDPRGVFEIDECLALEVSGGDEALLEAVLDKLASKRLKIISVDAAPDGMTAIEPGTRVGWFINFAERQERRRPSDEPESTRERKRKQRERESASKNVTRDMRDCHEGHAVSRLQDSTEHIGQGLNSAESVENSTVRPFPSAIGVEA